MDLKKRLEEATQKHVDTYVDKAMFTEHNVTKFDFKEGTNKGMHLLIELLEADTSVEDDPRLPPRSMSAKGWADWLKSKMKEAGIWNEP